MSIWRTYPFKDICILKKENPMISSSKGYGQWGELASLGIKLLLTYTQALQIGCNLATGKGRFVIRNMRNAVLSYQSVPNPGRARRAGEWHEPICYSSKKMGHCKTCITILQKWTILFHLLSRKDPHFADKGFGLEQSDQMQWRFLAKIWLFLKIIWREFFGYF